MTNELRNIDQLRTNELKIVKNGFWKPVFELTDGQYIYAKLSYRSNFKRNAIIETLQNNWTIKRKGWLNRILVINQGEDKFIGSIIPETWKRDFDLKLSNGFEATYFYENLFSRSLTLKTDDSGDILYITHKAFNLKRPFSVKINLLSNPEFLPSVPLIIMVGLHVILLRQRRTATAN